MLSGCGCGRFLKSAQVPVVSQRRSGIKDEHVKEVCDAVQIGWSTFLWLVVIGAGDTEGEAMFAGGLGIIWVIPGAPHLASATGVTTCGREERRGLIEGARK